MKFQGIFPNYIPGILDLGIFPRLFHEYPTNDTYIFLGGSRNAIVDKAVPDIRWVSLKI